VVGARNPKLIRHGLFAGKAKEVVHSLAGIGHVQLSPARGRNVEGFVGKGLDGKEMLGSEQDKESWPGFNPRLSRRDLSIPYMAE